MSDLCAFRGYQGSMMRIVRSLHPSCRSLDDRLTCRWRPSKHPNNEEQAESADDTSYLERKHDEKSV